MATNLGGGKLDAKPPIKRRTKKESGRHSSGEVCITRVPAEGTRHAAFLHRGRKSGSRAVKSCTGILGGRDAVPTPVQDRRGSLGSGPRFPSPFHAPLHRQD